MPTTSAADGLLALPPHRWAEYLLEHSGLPGPRANLEFADAFAAAASRDLVLEYAGRDEEYLRFCGTEALGRLVVEEPAHPEHVALLRERARDPLWRVREGAARALQRVGDSVPHRLREITAEWARQSDPFVQRAALAAICEPRLLRDPRTRALALELCDLVTAAVTTMPPQDRRGAGARALRQALGYCWSVAVAADPGRGLPAFRRWQEVDDPDGQWIIRSNISKARLRRLLPV